MNPFIQNRIDTIYDTNPSVPAWRASFYWLADARLRLAIEDLVKQPKGEYLLISGHVCEAVAVGYEKLADTAMQFPLQADEFNGKVYGAPYTVPADVAPHMSQRVMRETRLQLAANFRNLADKLFRRAAEAGELTATFVELPSEYQGVARRAPRKALDRLAPKTAMAQHVFGPMRPLVGEGNSEDYSGLPSA